MQNFTSQFNRRVTPQSQPIYGRTDQVQNNADGFVFHLSPWDQLQRFLVLGTAGGTYYATEQDLTKQNHDVIVKLIKEEGRKVVEKVVEMSESGRAPKNDPAIFVLALCATHGDTETKTAVGLSITRVCRTGTHILHFCQFANDLRGWGRSLRDNVACWYEHQNADQLAYQLVKYQSRDGWSHRDALRLSHAYPQSDEMQALFRWAVGVKCGDRKFRKTDKVYSASWDSIPKIVLAFELAKMAKTEEEIVILIQEFNLPRECIPTQFLNSPKVWGALLTNMPLTALVRNMGKMTAIGLLKPLSAETDLVCQRLNDEAYIRKSRLHPLAILTALRVYEQGHGMKGDLSWTPVQQICTALDKAFYLAFGNVESTGKNFLIALDISGSMGMGTIAGSPLTPRDAAATLALVIASREPKHMITGFSDVGLLQLAIRPGMRLNDAVLEMQKYGFGGTDCALPFIAAQNMKLNVDAFITITDNETWAGNIHPVQALNQYRNTSGKPNAKSIVIGMTATGFTINDPNDKNGLDVVGFDSAVPQLIADFIKD